jgi:hypothetical protein
VVSGHGMVVAGPDEAPVPCLRGEGMLILPSPFEAMWNSLMESLVMAHSGDGVPPRDEPIMTAPEPFLMGERLRLPKWSVMNSRFPKQIISSRVKTSHDRRSPSMATMSADEGTIRTSSGKARYKSPFLTRQLSVCFCTSKIHVVKIARSYSEVVLQTTKHTMVYPGLGPS